MKDLRILTARFSNEMNHKILSQSLKGFPVDFCASICTEKRFVPDLPQCPAVWIDSRELKWCHYTVDWNDITPLDEEIVQNMHECECVFLDILTRLDNKGKFLYEERYQHYKKHLRFWNDFLDRHRINFFLSISLPHEIPDFIIYSLCKVKGIPVLFFHHGRIQDTLFLMQDWEESAIDLRDRFQEISRGYQGSEIQLPDKFESYFQSQSKKGEGPRPWDMLLTAPSSRLNEAVSFVGKHRLSFVKVMFLFFLGRLSPRFWVEKCFQIRRLRRARRMFRFYDDHTVIPDLSRKYVYLPLHMQPECSTVPMGGAYANQWLIVQLLSAYLPDDVYIYIKEHPRQQERFPDGRCRSLDFYKDLLAMKRVRFVPRGFNSFLLIEHALAIATVTGTASFEALFRGKPVLLFGHQSFQYAPGIFRIHSVADCHKALEQIMRGEGKPTHEHLRLFLKAMSDVVFPGFLGGDFEKYSKLTREENIRSVSQALTEKVPKVAVPLP